MLHWTQESYSVVLLQIYGNCVTGKAIGQSFSNFPSTCEYMCMQVRICVCTL